MKSEIKFTGIVAMLAILSLQLNAQQTEKTYDKKDDVIARHNNYVFDHAKAMENAIAQSDKKIEKKAFRKHIRGIKSHTHKAKKYVKALQKKEKNLKESEVRFNRMIEHYDNILQEEFQIEKELGMPGSDRHKIASHLTTIFSELNEIKKQL
jgi:hypothetical protein